MLRSTTRSGRAALRLFAAAQALLLMSSLVAVAPAAAAVAAPNVASDPGIAPTAPFGDLTCTTLTPLPVSANTGEKPQSKVWKHDGAWWAVLPTTSRLPRVRHVALEAGRHHLDERPQALERHRLPTPMSWTRARSPTSCSTAGRRPSSCPSSTEPARTRRGRPARVGPITLDSGVETATIALDFGRAHVARV